MNGQAWSWDGAVKHPINGPAITVEGTGASNVEAEIYVECEGCAWCSSGAQSIDGYSSGTKAGGLKPPYLSWNAGKLMGRYRKSRKYAWGSEQ